MGNICQDCKHYGAVINKGMWWCDINKDMAHPETCDGHEITSVKPKKISLDVAIVGSRDFNDYEAAEKYIDEVCQDDFISIGKVISGGAKGADSIAEEYARRHGIETMIFKPDWEKYGKSAGFRRNVDIIDACDICIAFWDGKSKGTKHDIDLCKSKGKILYVYRYENNNGKGI